MKGLAAFLVAATALAQTAPDFVKPRPAAPAPPVLARALAALDEARLGADIRWLADPARAGRGLGTPSLDATAAWVEGRLRALKLAPLGASFRQAVPLRQVRPSGGRVELAAGDVRHAFPGGTLAVLPALAPGQLEAPWVFAGHGIQEPALGHDDLAGLDVRGKVVVLQPGLPEGSAWQRPDLREKYDPPRPGDRYDTRLALLASLGARAVVALEPGLAARLASGQEAPAPFFLPDPAVQPGGEPPLARIGATPALLDALRQARQGQARIETAGPVRSFLSVNVLARLEGSDPRLKGEAVLLGAHLDHLGLAGGKLHPGADDNASGVAALLEIARVLAAGPRPKRTVLFAFWTGEEEGKFGSGHYVRHPRWPLARTAAYLNLDMVGHPWTEADLAALLKDTGHPDPAGFRAGLDLARFAEPGLSSAHRDLGPVVAQAGQASGMALHLDWTDGRSGGSDYRDFARKGLPFVRFFGSYFPEYHTPGDTADKVDPAQVKRMAALALSTAWLLAQR